MLVQYDDHRTWGGDPNKPPETRPYTEIQIFGPTGSIKLWALLDTGADYILLDDAVAQVIGVTLQNYSSVSYTTAGGGSVYVTEVDNSSGSILLELEIETRKKQLKKCLFTSGQTTPILGRTTLLSWIDVGFDTKGWMFRKDRTLPVTCNSCQTTILNDVCPACGNSSL